MPLLITIEKPCLFQHKNSLTLTTAELKSNLTPLCYAVSVPTVLIFCKISGHSMVHSTYSAWSSDMIWSMKFRVLSVIFFPFSSLNEARSPSGFFFFSPAAGSMGKTVCYWFRYIPNSCLHPVDRTFQISRLINPRDFRVTPWRHAIHTQGQSWALCGLLYNTIIQQIRIHKPHSQFQKLQLIFLIIVFWCHAKDCIRIYKKGDGSSQRGFKVMWWLNNWKNRVLSKGDRILFK